MSKVSDWLDANVKDTFIAAEKAAIEASTRDRVIGCLRQVIQDLGLEPTNQRVRKLYKALGQQPYVPPVWVSTQAAARATKLYNDRVARVEELVKSFI